MNLKPDLNIIGLIIGTQPYSVIARLNRKQITNNENKCIAFRRFNDCFTTLM